jgi:hypothetical protein
MWYVNGDTEDEACHSKVCGNMALTCDFPCYSKCIDRGKDSTNVVVEVPRSPIRTMKELHRFSVYRCEEITLLSCRSIS